MKMVQAPRASVILYNMLKSQDNSNPWLLPANICPIVPIAFYKAGVPFVFMDISAETLHMDLEQAEGRLKRGKVGGVLYAHTYGEPSTPVEFFQSVQSRYPEVLLVDDRCLHPGQFMEVQGVTITGRARQLSPKGREWRSARTLFLDRHSQLRDFVDSPSTALFHVDVVRGFHVSRFQQVFEWTPARSK